MSPPEYAAESAAHYRFADRTGALAAGLLGKVRRHLGGDAGGDRARHIAGHRLRSRQHLAARPADAEQVAEPIADAMKETDVSRRLALCIGRRRARNGARRRKAAAGLQAPLQNLI